MKFLLLYILFAILEITYIVCFKTNVNLSFNGNLLKKEFYPTINITPMSRISNLKIPWQQLNAYRHVDMIRMICWSLEKRYPVSGSPLGDNALLRSKENGQPGQLIDGLLQCKCGMLKKYLNTLIDKPWTRLATAPEDHTRCHFCQLRTGTGTWQDRNLRL